MCGRFAYYETEDLEERYGLAGYGDQSVRASYNVAPGQQVPVVTGGDGAPRLRVMRWGFIPHWAKSVNDGYKNINARSETVFEKPTWKTPILHRRCLIPANGFYEWKLKSDGKTKQPYYIRPVARGTISFAGVHGRWHDPDGGVIDSFSILTTAANADMQGIHDRMPIILDREAEHEWLDESLDTEEKIAPFLAASPVGTLAMTPVNPYVNRVANNDRTLIAPVAEEE